MNSLVSRACCKPALFCNQKLGRRYLGNSVKASTKGVDACFRNIAKWAKQENRIIRYGEFKELCYAFRTITFWGCISAICLDWLIRPPRSSYWRQFSPLKWVYATEKETKADVFNVSNDDSSILFPIEDRGYTHYSILVE
eukprot:Platyproteum_vivax@DN15988_c0_g1_i1.p1